MAIPGDLHITSTNHGGYVAVATALLTVWMLLFYFTRVFIRLRFTSWGPDDWAITIGTCLALFQVSCVFVAIHNGFGLVGNLLMEGQHRTIEKDIYASQIFYIATICTAKCSTAFLITRLTRTKGHLLAARIIVGFTIIWSVGAILIIAVRDNHRSPWEEWDDPGSKLYARWIAIETVGMAIEVALVVLAATLVSFLSMTSKIRYVVIGAFSVRLLTLIPTIFRLVYLQPHRNYVDPTFFNVPTLVITQVCMHLSLITATIPCLKPFIQPFEAEYSGELGETDQRKKLVSPESPARVHRKLMPTFMFDRSQPIPDNRPRPSVVSYYSTAEDNQNVGRLSQACLGGDNRVTSRKSRSLSITTRGLVSPLAQEEWMMALRNPAAAPLAVRKDTLGFEVTVDSGEVELDARERTSEMCRECSRTTSLQREVDNMDIHQLKEVKVEYSSQQPL